LAAVPGFFATAVTGFFATAVTGLFATAVTGLFAAAVTGLFATAGVTEVLLTAAGGDFLATAEVGEVVDPPAQARVPMARAAAKVGRFILVKQFIRKRGQKAPDRRLIRTTIVR
jgi:hypothetical protein